MDEEALKAIHLSFYDLTDERHEVYNLITGEHTSEARYYILSLN